MTKQRWTIHNISISVNSKLYASDAFPTHSRKPESIPKEKFWIEMEFDVGHWDFEFKHGIPGDGNYFQLDVITVDYLSGFILKNGLAAPQFVMIVEDYVEQEIVDYVNKLLDQCSNKDWDATDKFLSLFMAGKYESHITPNFNPRRT